MKSLIPLLNSDSLSIFKLKITSSKIPEAKSPFALLGNNGLISRMVEGELFDPFDDYGRKIILYCQKDEYPIEAIKLKLNNRKIYNSWIRKVKQYSKKNKDIALEQLPPDNITDSIQPFDPIFVCKHKGRYFHPPCPTCGKKLYLCTDEDLLAKIGVESYSSSITRYLYCDTCVEKKFSLFVKNFSDIDRENAFVKNQRELFDSFNNLENISVDRSTYFPCNACEEYPACYGNLKKASERLDSFAFYPFFLIVIDSDILNYKTFLRTVCFESDQLIHNELAENPNLKTQNGVAVEKRTRASKMVLRIKKEYLKVFLVKLRLIKQIAIFVSENIDYLFFPDCGFDPHNIWLKVMKNDETDKLHWHFKLLICDTGELLSFFSNNGALESNYGKQFLITIWLYTLLYFNDFDLTVDDVNLFLDKANRDDLFDNDLYCDKWINGCLKETQLIQKHQNLLSLLGSEYESLFLLAVKAGLKLLKQDLSNGSRQTYDPMIREIDDLFKLSQSYLVLTDYEILKEDNRRIAAILGSIRRKWSENSKEDSSFAPESVKSEKRSKHNQNDGDSEADGWNAIPKTFIQNFSNKNDPVNCQAESNNDNDNVWNDIPKTVAQNILIDDNKNATNRIDTLGDDLTNEKIEPPNTSWNNLQDTFVQRKKDKYGKDLPSEIDRKETNRSDWLNVPATTVQNPSEHSRSQGSDDPDRKEDVPGGECEDDDDERGNVSSININTEYPKDRSWDDLPKTVVQINSPKSDENLAQENNENRKPIDISKIKQADGIENDSQYTFNSGYSAEEDDDFLTETILLSTRS